MKDKFMRISAFIVIIFIFTFIYIKNNKNIYKKVGLNNYSSAQIDGFEMNVFNSTGWALINLDLKSSPNSNSTTIRTVGEGLPFRILGVSGDYFEIIYGGDHGYVLHDYCMINLPDVVPSIKYNITNAYSATYITRDSSGNLHNIDGITGQILYGRNCSNGICQNIGDSKTPDGKLYNGKIGRNEFIVPSLFSTAKMIAKGEVQAKNSNKRLMIYDSYRPVSVSQKVSDAFAPLINNGTANIGNWDRTWFIATIQPGVNASAHNFGAAIDVSLYNPDTNQEVTDMPTSIHELSVAATRCTDSSCSQFSSGMSNSASSMLLSNIMTGSNVEMTPLASEWWHFQDNAGLSRMKNATNITGRDFQVTGIYSDFGFAANLTRIGDVNGDGRYSYEDANIVYKFYNFSKNNTCETCQDLIHYSDMNGNGMVDLNDVFLILNPSIRSDHSGFNKDNRYIYIGSKHPIDTSIISVTQPNDSEIPISTSISDNKFQIKIDNVVVREYNVVNVYGLDVNYLNGNYILSSDVQTLQCTNCTKVTQNNKLYIKYRNDNSIVFKTYDIVSFSYPGHDLSKPYIFSSNSVAGFNSDIQNQTFNCTNCTISYDSGNKKVYIKYGNTNVKSYDLVYYVSNYDLNSSSINVNESTVSDLLSKITCVNCTAGVYKDNNIITSEGIPSGSSIIIKENVTNSKEQLRSVLINSNSIVSVTGVTLNNSNLSLNVGSNSTLVANVSPSNASNKSVTWESSDTNVATVDNGVITAKNVGSTVITVRTADGGFTATCNVTVLSPTEHSVVYKKSDGTIFKTEQFLSNENVIQEFADIFYVQGKKFIGWKYNGNIYSLDDQLLMPDADIELVAQYADVLFGNLEYDVNKDNGINYLSGIVSNTDIGDLDNFGLDSEYIVKVYYGQSLKTSGKVGTGNIIKVFVNDSQNYLVESYTAVVKGDNNGDGVIDVSDVSNIYKHIKGKSHLYYERGTASNVNGDLQIDVSDISNIYKFIKGKLSF